MQHATAAHLFALCLLCGTAARAAEPSMDDPASQRILAAMARTSTWGHPDEMGEFTGMRYYADHKYAKAMKWFLDGARYADKPAQLDIGLMYLNGEGVAKDPVMAYAWTAVAAERNYPQFVATRESIWAQLDPDQRQRAKAAYDTLYATYGDPVAKRRLIQAMRMASAETRSLYLGAMVQSIFVGRPGAQCASPTMDGAPAIGCGSLDYYSDARWKPEPYFKMRDSMWTGTVSVGDVQQVKPEASAH